MSLYKSYSDTELATRLIEGDHVAYTEIYNRYAGLLYLHAAKSLSNKEEAKDLIQELFTSFWNNRFTFKLNTNLSAYLYTAVRYKVIKSITKKRLELNYFESLTSLKDNGQVVTDYLVREKELAQAIEREIDNLPAKMRKVFYMSRKLYLSHKEIAEKLELSEATVKKQVNNALKILRVKLQPFLFLVLLISL